MTRRARTLLTTLAALLAHGAGSGAWRLEDPLRGSTRGNAVGGSFASDGWHVTARTDRVWYAVPRLVEGSVEFTVTGLTMSLLSDTNDNELFAMYEAGYGIAEPISYSFFRENHYKCMLRVYANGETGRAGQQKLMWGMCPGASPGYGSCACGTSFFEEPFGGNGTWDGSPQRMRVAWGAGVTRLSRNGSVAVTVDWSRSGLTFGPESLHVSLGTSRPSAVGTAQLPVGIVFSDLVIDGTEGPLGVCPGAPVTDAGTAPIDSGIPLSPNVIELPAVEDVTVDPAHATTVYPDVNDLAVGAGDSEFYVKFRVGSLPGRVVRAQLILRSGAYASAVGTGANVFAAARSDWSESTLTWSARPGGTGARLARIDGVSEDTTYTVDLPAGAVTAAGTYAFAVLPAATDTNSAHFDARERSPSRAPTLRLTVDPTMPVVDASVPVTDAPSPIDVVSPRDVVLASDVVGPRDVVAANDVVSLRDVVTPTDAPAPRADATDVTVDEPVSGACGCRASRTDHGPLAILALASLALRRRRGARA